MTREIELPLGPLSDQSFEPYGRILGPGGRAADFEASHLSNWRVDFEADGPAEILFIRYKYQAPVFQTLERHFHVSQGFVPLNGAAAIMVVAKPTDPGDAEAIPAPTEIRAFLMDGSTVVILHRGTWHALSRFAVAPPHIDFAFLTERATQADIEASGRAGEPPERTQIVDYGARFNLSFRVVDPEGLLR